MIHRFPVTIYYEDTDMGGIVYHANYLKFIERARSDWVRRLGVDQNELRTQGVVFAIHRIEADFLAPARLDDRVQVVTIPVAGASIKSGRARMTLDQQVWRFETCLFKARVTLVAISCDGRPRRLPPELATLANMIREKA